MSSIQIESNKLAPDTYVELFDFDASVIGGTTSYYTNTPTGGVASPITWRTNNYYPLAFELKGVENRGDGTAPNRPQITITNVNKFTHAAIASLGDLSGMRITRWRTFYKFTDGQVDANPLVHYPEDLWIVTKQVAVSKQVVQYELSTPLDRPGLRLPRELILKDLGFPGVGRVRLR